MIDRVDCKTTSAGPASPVVRGRDSESAPNPRHVTTAQLGRRFANFTIELLCPFYDENASIGRLRLSMSAVAAPEKAPR